MRATGKYQQFDPLTPEDFAALEKDILERGVMVAIERDEDGNRQVTLDEVPGKVVHVKGTDYHRHETA